MREGAVYLDEITHCFGNQTLFQKLSVGFEKKKITALLGKSGSGKSTLLQMINGLVKPDEGTVFLSGQPLDYQRLHSIRLTIGYAVQQVGLFPHMKTYENITLLGVLAKWDKSRIKKRAENLMQSMGLPLSYKNKYPHQLSGGEQQRVGLCRAILLDPPLMLLDEPFSSLDTYTKESIHEEIINLQQREPRCIILVTHDPNEAKKLGDVQLHFEHGRILPINQ